MSSDAGLVRDFANTLDVRSFQRRGIRQVGGDTFTSAAELGSWLRERDLLGPRERVTELDRTAAAELREALRSALARTQPPLPMPGTFTVHVGISGPELVPVGTGVTWALGSILVAALRLAATGQWQRLKMCPDPDCHWVFDDRSRSGGRRWCATELCGNRAKTRAYRERQQTRQDLR